MIFDTGQNGGKENVSMILIDYKDRRPLYEQIVEKLSDLMVRGFWSEDSQLPSVRSLATELSMNPNTIQRAYAELERQGYIYSVKGRAVLWRITGRFGRGSGRRSGSAGTSDPGCKRNRHHDAGVPGAGHPELWK